MVLLSEATRGAAQPLSADAARFVPTHLKTVFDAPSTEIVTVMVLGLTKENILPESTIVIVCKFYALGVDGHERRLEMTSTCST